MESEAPSGTDWTDYELDLIVADYFAMLTAELAGEHYSKSEHRAKLRALIPNRSDGSVEFKHQNISAVLLVLGQPWIQGYKPAKNFQKTALPPAIERYLTENPGILEQRVVSPPTVESVDAVFVDVPPRQEIDLDHPEIKRLIRKFDPAARDERNRTLGKAGEQFVFELEKRQLVRNNRPDLAQRVRWVADSDGDGAGYQR